MNSSRIAVSIEAGSEIQGGLRPTTPFGILGALFLSTAPRAPSHLTAASSECVWFSAVTAGAL